MQKADLLDLFEINGVDISDDEIDSFGEKDYILYRIENELNIQFNTRKEEVLKTMASLISNKAAVDDVESFSLFGTNSFNMVWEKVCADYRSPLRESLLKSSLFSVLVRWCRAGN